MLKKRVETNVNNKKRKNGDLSKTMAKGAMTTEAMACR